MNGITSETFKNILLIALVIFFITLIFALRDYPLNKPPPPKVVTDVITIETFDNNTINNSKLGTMDTNTEMKKNIEEKIKKIELMKEIDELGLNEEKSFCSTESGEKSSKGMEMKCNKLSENKCNSVDCCVWTSNNKCSSGSIDGPIFNTDENGNDIKLDYYYFKTKCYGNNCPTTST